MKKTLLETSFITRQGLCVNLSITYIDGRLERDLTGRFQGVLTLPSILDIQTE
jgi:hypothetical protein